MLIETSGILTQIQTSKEKWNSVAPSISQTNPLADEVSMRIDQVEALLEASPEELEVAGVPWQVFLQHLSSFDQHAGNASQINSLAVYLWNIENALLDALPTEAIDTGSEKRESKKLESRAILIEKYLSQAEQSKAQLEGIAAKASDLDDNVVALTSSSQQAYDEIVQHKDAAAEQETAARNSASEAQTKLDEMSEFLNGIKQATGEQKVLFEEFEERRDEVANLLENANKVGLAKSFQDKRKELTWTWRFWAFLFSVGVITVSVIGYWEILPLLEAEEIDLPAVIFRFMLSAPLIWFTWFAARQYGHILRVSEDYAFKEAAAMAFVGYRNEMETDPAMLKLLQEYAIKNFSENPARMLLKKPDAASPLHDALEKALEKIKPEDFLKIFKQ